MNVDDLPTPSVLIEKKRLESNLKTMQARADENNVALRPHTKTHKSVQLATWQQELGAKGITVAKVGEAEIYCAGGIKDIRLAYCTVGRDKYERIAKLKESCRISFCVDSDSAVDVASNYFDAANLEVEVLIEVDTGYGRCGVNWDGSELTQLAKRIDEAPGLTFVGILTHAGHSYKGPQSGETKEEALRRASNSERDRMLEAGARLKAAGYPPNEISVGSTPSMRYFENAERDGLRITEIRPGNYVFHDLMQVGLGAATLHDCALTVWTSVISVRPRGDGTERFFLDAGKKVFTSDLCPNFPGYGMPLYNSRTMIPLPHVELDALSEEHGWVRVNGGATVEVGDRLRVIPNHACVVANTQRKMYLVDGYDVVEELTVDAQSAVT